MRFKRAVANAIKNMVEKERNRQRFIPTVAIGRSDDVPTPITRDDDNALVGGFRALVRHRLGELGVAVLDARLHGREVKSLVGREDLGSPGKYVVKRAIGQVKSLAREFAQRLGDPAFFRDIERAMGRETATVAKRRATTAARRVR